MSSAIIRALSGVVKSPKDIPGLAFWYDFSDANNLVITGGNTITQVTDKSGNGLHLDTKGTNFPGYSANQRNGLSVGNFTQTGDAVISRGTTLRSDAIIGGSGQEISLFAAHRCNSGGGTILHFTNAANQFLNFNWKYSDSNVYSDFHNGSTGRIFAAAPANYAGAWHIDSYIHRSGSAEHYVDRALVASASNLSNGAFTDSSLGTLRLGRNASNNWHNGNIGEIFGVRRAVSAQERAAIEKYLMRKWGFDT